MTKNFGKGIINYASSFAFVLGLTVATLGWYLTDRLDIAFGKSADIDVISIGREDPGFIGGNCQPGNVVDEIQGLKDCNLLSRKLTCLPVKKYLNVIRTRTGTNIFESTKPTKRSRVITKYENRIDNIETPISVAADQISRDLTSYAANFKNGKQYTDPQYKALSERLSAISKLRNSPAGRTCPQL